MSDCPITADGLVKNFDPSVATAMHKQEPPPPGEDFRIAIVGAKLGPRLKVVALIDPDVERAKHILELKCNSFVISAYQDTVVYPTLVDFLAACTPENAPRIVWVGSPPAFRGGHQPGRNLEVLIVDKLPQAGIFIEKPVSTSSVQEAAHVSQYLRKKDNIISVGYMLRYLKVVQKMKQIIAENNLVVMAVNARYAMAYPTNAKAWWWNKDESLGPVIEQATHFCDLARYFGGEVDFSTVIAHTVEHHEEAGKLSKIAVCEDDIPPEKRIPRVTNAMWKFTSGAVGSLMHLVALHGQDFATELEVFADGYSLRLCDPYNAPTLYLRRPEDDHEEVLRYQDDDPFFSEVANLIDCVEHGPNAAPILSSYEDAVKTYALTWAIRLASERRTKDLQELAAALEHV
ncbi:hypothetical protein MSPP1_003329 [Malassezia sp. CBS 17886]|nr:hypothetical protein MSPP1_003329 [Malassezia sp. CBS 17886]